MAACKGRVGLAVPQWRTAWYRAGSPVPVAGSGRQRQAAGLQGRGPTQPKHRLSEGHMPPAEAQAEPRHHGRTAGTVHGSCGGKRGQHCHRGRVLRLRVLCQPRTPEREAEHRDRGGPPHHVASLTCSHQVKLAGAPTDRAVGWASRWPAWGSILHGSQGPGPCPQLRELQSWPCPSCRGRQVSSRVPLSLQRSLAPAHPSVQGSPCWASAQTSARRTPTAPGARSAAGMAAARSPA